MAGETLAKQLGLTGKDLEKLNQSEKDIRLGLQALSVLEELGLRSCEEREDCEAMLNQIEQVRARIFGSTLSAVAQ